MRPHADSEGAKGIRPDTDLEGGEAMDGSNVKDEGVTVQVARVQAAAQVMSSRWLAAAHVRSSRLLAEAQKQQAEAQRQQANSIFMGAMFLMAGLIASALILLFGIENLSVNVRLRV